MEIPLVDINAENARVLDDVAPAMRAIMESGAFILGPAVAAFERAFAEFCTAPHCIGVGCGLDALRLSLRALNIGPGDEVILPANTFIATALAVSEVGAQPVLVDCDKTTYLMRTDRVADVITDRTKAILPVHLYGQCADMDAILAVAKDHALPVIEDAAQAHGATYNGRLAGSMSAMGCFSFYPAKNLGAFGDGGAVVTHDAAHAEAVRMLRNYGQREKYVHVAQGTNSRLDTIQAVVLSLKLKHLAANNAARRERAQWYRRRLQGIDDVVAPVVAEGNEHVWHLFVVRVPHRDRVLEALHADGVGAGIHYPVPVHLHEAYAALPYARGDFPVAEKAAEEILSLPLFPTMTEAQVDTVCDALHRALGH